MKQSTIFKNRSVQNAAYLIAGRVLQMAFGFIVTLLTARFLGPSDYGLINYATAYTAFFTAICTLGINNVLVKEFIDHPGEEGRIIGTSLGLRAASSLLSFVVILSISCILDAGEPITILVVLLASLGMIFQIAETFNYWFQSRLESKITAGATLGAYLLSSAYKLFLLITGGGVQLFALATSLDYLCLGAILYGQYRKHRGGKLHFSWAYGKLLLEKSHPFILSGMMIAVYGHTDKLMLKQMIGDAEIGYYATAVTLCRMWCFILSAIIESLQPSILEANRNGNALLFRKRNLLLYAIVFHVSMMASAGITIFAKPIVTILYGASYLPAAKILRIATWYTAFSYLGVARTAWIVSRNKQKYLFRVYAASAAANVLFNLILIPRWGASGAAMASLVAQVFTTLVVPFFIRDIRENSLLMLDAICLKGMLWGRDKGGTE